MEKFSAGVRRRAEEIARRAGRPFLCLGSSRTDKEKLVREVMERGRIEEGWVCILACVGPCSASGGIGEERQLQLVARERKRLHLYCTFLPSQRGLWVDAHSPTVPT